MDLPQDSHDLYFHVRVLIGVVLGLALTRMLTGVSRWVQHPGKQQLSAIHLLWVATIIVTAIQFWWWEFGLIRITTWRFEFFLFVLLYAFVFFLLASLLFPEEMGEYDGYEDYFLSRRRWFFALLATTVPIDLVDTLAKGRDYYVGMTGEYPVRLALFLILCAVAFWTPSRRFHLAFAAFYLLYLLSWILRRNDVLGL